MTGIKSQNQMAEFLQNASQFSPILSANSPSNSAPNSLQNPTQLSPQEYAQMQAFVARAFDFARADDAQSLGVMLDYGLNANLANDKGDSLLMLAAYHGAARCVRLLLARGARADAPNDKGLTPLAGAAFKGHAEVARLLLAHGANPRGNGERLNAINTAILFGRREILRMLLAYDGRKLGFFGRLIKRIAGA